MDFDLSEYQKMLRDSAREFFAKEMPITEVRKVLESQNGYSNKLWKQMADMGWLGIMIPERYGGTGGEFMDVAVVLAEMGRAFIPGPYLPTMFLGALPIVEYGTDKQKMKYLPPIPEGKSMFSIAVVEEDGQYGPESIRTTVKREGTKFVLSGTKLFVPYGLTATNLICVAKEQGGPFYLVVLGMPSPQVRREPLDTMPREFYAKIVLDNVEVGPEEILARFEDFAKINLILEKAALGRCAQIAGLAEHVLDITVEYAKSRVQFQRPIGSFQAVQHQAADMLLEVDGCRLLTYEACSRLSQGKDYETAAAMAKFWCSQSFKKIMKFGLQINGGVSLIEEHELPMYYRFAWSSASLFGDTEHYGEIIARKLESAGKLLD